jgi:bacterioferritin-associated ferredoxin
MIREVIRMYVCICNAICQSELRSAARNCSGDAEAVYAKLGRAPQCRQCLDEAEDLLAKVRSEYRQEERVCELV